MEITDPREIIRRENYDVIVVGGGVAGVCAAVAAARQGVSALLLEKGIVLGGLATAGLISWYEPLCDGAGKKMIGGIPEELLRLAIRDGFDDLPVEWADGGKPVTTKARYATHFSPMIFAMALDGYLKENGVTLLLDSMVVFPAMEGGRCAGVVAESAEGKVFYGAKAVVDATGDAAVLERAGVPTQTGDNFLTYSSQGFTYALACDYAKDKNLAKFRKWIWAGSDLEGHGHPEGMKKFIGATAAEITEFVLTGRKMLFDQIRGGGKDDRDVVALPSMPQFRTVRHLVGEYVFTGRELDQKFDDAVGSAGDFRSSGKHYQIPYGCLYHRDFDNLLAAGRVVSATGDGWEVTRVIPVAAMTGQAAGVAAALCASGGKRAGEIDIRLLQRRLRDGGVLFE